MTNYKRGDIVLVEFIFSSRDGSKRRPGLVLSAESYNKTRHELIIAAITSNIERKLPGETVLKNWKDTGLLYPSTVTAIIQTIKTDMVKRRLGQIMPNDMMAVEKNIGKAMGFK